MNGSRRARVHLVFVLVLLMLVGGATRSVAVTVPIDFSEQPFATDAGAYESDAEISGGLVAYTYRPVDVGAHSEVAVRQLKTGLTGSIGSGDLFDDENADVSLGRIVYQSNAAGNWDIRYWDWWNGYGGPLTVSTAHETHPRIDGNLIVYSNETAGMLAFTDLRRGYGGLVPGATAMVPFDVDNGRIVWGDRIGGVARVHLWRPDGLGAATLFEAAGDFEVDWVRVHGDTVAFAVSDPTGSRTYVCDLASAELLNFPTHTSAHDEEEPVVFNRRFVWRSWPEGNSNLWFKDLSEGSTLTEEVSTSNQNEHAPSMFGRRVVYSREEAMSTDLWMATSSWKDVDRTAGANRYATAAEVSERYFSAADVAVVCTGENFPDALSATPLARVAGGPLLLTRRDSVPAETLAELDRLGVGEVVIVGGTSAVSSAVADTLDDDYIVSRLDGIDRYETSSEVARAIAAVLPAGYGANRAFFARGDAFPDALAIGPVAAGAYAPVLLVRTDSVPPAIATAIDDLDIQTGAIAGGTVAVSETTMEQLKVMLQDNGG
ncbi:MAG: cell wall-binding repeat-containing protein [Coriobacteriia bacterium]|nr:cell wall-binding repeat-containing protein [Coriobacteriia bacterium]